MVKENTAYNVQRIAYSFIVLCFLSGIAFAQDVTFRAVVNKDKTAVNDPVELTLIVTGAQDTGSPQLPELDGFSVVSSGTSSQFSFVNGHMSASKSFNYILMPQKEGKFTIPPVKIEAEGKTLETEPIEVEVLGGGQAGLSQQKQMYEPQEQKEPQQGGIEDRIFIKVTADKNTAYIGEQITLMFKLYYKDVRIDNIQYTPPVTKGFVTEPMGNQKEYRDLLGGVIYNIVELKTAVFPATEGELEIEPAKLKCDILVREQRRTAGRRGMYDDFFDDFFEDPFFGNYVRYPLALESETVKINVKPIPPENKPNTFNGSVGAYDLTVDVTPLSLKAGEPINLIMKVKGKGNIIQVQEPAIKDLTGFKAYDSEVKTEITGRDPEIEGQKTFQKMIIPQNENVKEIPQIEFSYFNPAAGKYNAIKKGPFPITVSPGEKKDTGIVELIKETEKEDESKKAVQLFSRDIQYIEKSPGKITKIGQSWYKNIFLWIVIIAVPLIVLGVLSMYAVHRRKLQSDKAYAKAQGAEKAMRRFFAEAEKYKKEKKTKEFYDSIARVLQKYISDRLNVPIGAVTADAISAMLSSKDIAYETINNVKDILNRCDMVRFGAFSGEEQEMAQMIKDTENILRLLGKKL
jgi:hypothetical protein